MELYDQTGVDMHVNGPPGPAIWQIGSDGGFFNTCGEDHHWHASMTGGGDAH